MQREDIRWSALEYKQGTASNLKKAHPKRPPPPPTDMPVAIGAGELIDLIDSLGPHSVRELELGGHTVVDVTVGAVLFRQFSPGG